MFQRPPQAVVMNLYALCKEADSETTARLLKQPRTPKQGAFFIPKCFSNEKSKTEKGSRTHPRNRQTEKEALCLKQKIRYREGRQKRGVRLYPILRTPPYVCRMA